MITLATLAQATAQEVFDQVVNHARKQGVKSSNDDGGCLYRNEQGLVCFAGCLISDAQYDPRMDDGDSSWNGLIERNYVPSTHDELIKSLQAIHDDFQPDEWEDQFAMLAQYENLQYKEPLNG